MTHDKVIVMNTRYLNSLNLKHGKKIEKQKISILKKA
jgi:hypothetical protein